MKDIKFATGSVLTNLNTELFPLLPNDDITMKHKRGVLNSQVVELSLGTINFISD